MDVEKFILEVTKVMLPVLTGFLVFFAKAVGKIWEKTNSPEKNDYVAVIFISFFAFLSFGCWAGALAGSMISLAKNGGSIFFAEVSSPEAQLWARRFVGWAYMFFVVMIFSSGGYYMYLLKRKNGVNCLKTG